MGELVMSHGESRKRLDAPAASMIARTQEAADARGRSLFDQTIGVEFEAWRE